MSVTKMHGMSSINLANTQQAKAIYNYKNTKERLYRTHAATYMQRAVLVLLCFDRLPDDDTPLPKHVWVDTTNCILLFISYCIALSAFVAWYIEYKKMHRWVTLHSRKIRCILHSPDLSVAMDIQITNQSNKVSVSCIDRFISCYRLREVWFLLFVTFARAEGQILRKLETYHTWRKLGDKLVLRYLQAVGLQTGCT